MYRLNLLYRRFLQISTITVFPLYFNAFQRTTISSNDSMFHKKLKRLNYVGLACFNLCHEQKAAPVLHLSMQVTGAVFVSYVFVFLHSGFHSGVPQEQSCKIYVNST